MSVPVDREPWLTKAELAAQLRCSKRTIERISPPSMRVGGQNRYRLSEVEDYLRHRSRPARVLQFPESGKDSAA